MSEWIDTTNKNISTDKLEYHWNDKTCKTVITAHYSDT